METDALDYVLTAILSIVHEDNTHDKELLAIFEAFKIWRYYLEGLAYSINAITDYKNLKYFSITKILTQRQA